MLTVMDLAKVREETAYGWFRKMRWPETEGEPYCPKCGTPALPCDEPRPLQVL